MLLDLSFSDWLFLGPILAAGGFFVGSAMHGVMGTDGFGPLGNMTIMVAGAISFGFGIEYTPYRFVHDPTILAVVMVSGAFVTLAFLVLAKLGLTKLGA
ncbi:MAG: hypothetical protein AAGG69_10690 [Pseudomonadota bacterium]